MERIFDLNNKFDYNTIDEYVFDVYRLHETYAYSENFSYASGSQFISMFLKNINEFTNETFSQFHGSKNELLTKMKDIFGLRFSQKNVNMLLQNHLTKLVPFLTFGENSGTIFEIFSKALNENKFEDISEMIFTFSTILNFVISTLKQDEKAYLDMQTKFNQLVNEYIALEESRILIINNIQNVNEASKVELNPSAYVYQSFVNAYVEFLSDFDQTFGLKSTFENNFEIYCQFDLSRELLFQKRTKTIDQFTKVFKDIFSVAENGFNAFDAEKLTALEELINKTINSVINLPIFKNAHWNQNLRGNYY